MRPIFSKATILLLSVGLFLFPVRVFGQGGIVSDPIAHAIQSLMDSNRIAEFEQNYGSTLEMLSGVEGLLKEMGINTDFKLAELGNSEFFRNARGFANFGYELKSTTQYYINAINTLRYLTANGYLTYSDAARYTTAFSKDITDLIKLGKYVIYQADVLNQSLTAKQKLDMLDHYADSVKLRRQGYNIFMENLYNKIEREAEAESNAARWNAQVQDRINSNSGKLALNVGAVGFNSGELGSNFKDNLNNRTRKQISNDIKTKFWFDPSKDIRVSTKVAHDNLTGAKTPLLRLVELIIGMLAAFYLVLNFLRVTKGEGQSRDAILKVFLGLLFSAIAIIVLEKFFGSTGNSLNILK